MGKVNDKKQAEAFLHAGLLDPSKAVMKAGHAVGWQAGAIKNTNLALTDPLRWVEEVQNPALAKLGVNMTDRLDVAKALGTMYRNQNANLFVNTLTQEASASRLHKDEGLYNKAGTLEEIYKNDLGEFTVAAGAVEESLKSLSAAATAPLMHPVAEALSSLSEGVNSVAKYGFEHPTMAATAGIGAVVTALGSAGWLGMKLMNGFGLKGSAIALDGAAASLETAAGRLAVGGGGGGGGGSGSVLNKAGAAGEGAAVTNAGRAALAVPGAVEIGSAVVAGGIAVATIGLVKASAETQQPGKGGQWSAPTYGSLGLDRERLAAQQAEKAEVDAHIATIQAKSKLGPGMESPELFPLRDRSASLASSIGTLANQLTTLDRLPREDDRETRARGFVRSRDDVPLPPARPEAYTAPRRRPGDPGARLRCTAAQRHPVSGTHARGARPHAAYVAVDRSRLPHGDRVERHGVADGQHGRSRRLHRQGERSEGGPGVPRRHVAGRRSQRFHLAAPQLHPGAGRTAVFGVRGGAHLGVGTVRLNLC